MKSLSEVMVEKLVNSDSLWAPNCPAIATGIKQYRLESAAKENLNSSSSNGVDIDMQGQ